MVEISHQLIDLFFEQTEIANRKLQKMTNTTRIYRFHQYGNPEILQLDSVPMTQLGAGEVRLRVQAMGLNRADLLWLANTYVETPQLPSRIGYEIAGVVEEIASGVTEFQVGDRVSSIPAFSISDYANFGETAILPTRGLVRTPDNFSFVQGAAVYFQYFTGYERSSRNRSPAPLSNCTHHSCF